MVNQKYIAIAYICGFFSIYLCSIAYAMVPLVTQAELPQTAFTESVSMSISSFDLDAKTLLAGIALIIVAAIVLIVMMSVSTFKAY